MPKAKFYKKWYFFLVLGLFVGGIFFVIYRKKRNKDENKSRIDVDFSLELEKLKKRLKKSNSSSWLQAVHSLVKQWLVWKVGDADPKQTVELLYREYKDREDKNAEDWEWILKECVHVLYGGGIREPHHNRETLKKLYKCFEISEEDEI